MKNVSLSLRGLICLTFVGLSLNAFAGKDKKLKTKADSVSYYIGVNIGQGVQKQFENEKTMPSVNYELVVAGFKNVLVDKNVEMSEEDITAFLSKYFQEEGERIAKQKREEGAKFLEENKKNEGVMETESGLQYKVIKKGNDVHPAAENTVKCHYEGRLVDGTIFDSSYERGEPTEFPLNRVIPGWTEGLQLMGEGAEFEFYIPSELGYGERAMSSIPANSVLIFKVELISVVK